MYMGSVDCSKYEHCSEPTYIGSTPRSLLHNPADVGDIGPGGGPGGHLDGSESHNGLAVDIASVKLGEWIGHWVELLVNSVRLG